MHVVFVVRRVDRLGRRHRVARFFQRLHTTGPQTYKIQDVYTKTTSKDDLSLSSLILSSLAPACSVAQKRGETRDEQ